MSDKVRRFRRSQIIRVVLHCRHSEPASRSRVLIITDTVEEKPWLNFDTPAPIR